MKWQLLALVRSLVGTVLGPRRAPLLSGSLSASSSCVINTVSFGLFVVVAFVPNPTWGFSARFLCCQVVLCCSLLTASVLVLHVVKNNKCSWHHSITSAKEKDVKSHQSQPRSSQTTHYSCGDSPGQEP